LSPHGQDRVIVTKYRTYELPADAQSVPKYFAGVTLPEPLSRATVYETSDGPVVAMPRRRKRLAAEPGL
jgi:hypothetical protein